MNPHAARTTLVMLALAAAVSACASDPNAPRVPAGSVASTRTESNGDVVTEYRVNGALAMVRIEPARGVVYYLVDSDGDGRIDRQPHGSRDVPVYFKLYEW